MKKKSFKIGWQKYEDVMEKQLSCPILRTVMKNIVNQNIDIDEEVVSEYDDIEQQDDIDITPGVGIIPMSEELLKEVTILSNFDCWMGHTNFDITPSIKQKLNDTPGVEVLKICSRYRFFVGVGTMFDFRDVRKNIESIILPNGD